jgi:hypothetical protein
MVVYRCHPGEAQRGDHQVKRWIAHKLRTWADRIDHRGAPKAIGYSFTFERGEGLRFRQDGQGCPLWYLGDADYERAHGEADSR